MKLNCPCPGCGVGHDYFYDASFAPFPIVCHECGMKFIPASTQRDLTVKPKILMCIPRRPDINKYLAAENDALINKMTKWQKVSNSYTLEVVVDTRESGFDLYSNKDQESHKLFNDRCKYAMPKLRQAIIDDHLTDHDYVIWLDSDIVCGPVDLVDRLIDISVSHGEAITAPRVMCEWQPERWYDTAGFIYREGPNMFWANLYFPHFNNQDVVKELASVGCVYLVPADIYRSGAKHTFIREDTTDHYSVCLKALQMGRKVLCDNRISVYHANLNDYEGEFLH